MNCERCEDANIEDHPYHVKSKDLCLECLFVETKSMNLDLDNAVEMYKLRTPNNQDDDNFIKHVFAQVAGGYMQIADWWTDTENILDIANISGDRETLQGVELTCGTGGPHTWLDTRENMIYSRHGAVLAERSIDSSVCEDIVSFYEEIW